MEISLSGKEDTMQVIRKEIFIRHKNGDAPFPGFVSYISRDEPLLIHRYGWEVESDNRDNWVDCFSDDNGRTWSEPVPAKKSRAITGGRIKYSEHSAFFDVDTNQLITMAVKLFYPEDDLDLNQPHTLEMQTFDPHRRQWSEPQEVTFGFRLGLTVSFTFPIKTSKGKLLFPACKLCCGPDGKTVYLPGCDKPANESLVVIGEYQSNGTLAWRPGNPVAINLEQSSRGFDENTLIELADGRIAMVIRGSNHCLDLPGYKWVAFSSDDGQTWSRPVPWTWSDGQPMESSATGSALFRSILNQKIYWIGNICPPGVRAEGNWPRSPLVIGEVDETSFTLKRETLRIIDQRSGQDSPGTQLSNFRFYQDRQTGHIILFLTRFGERSEQQWKLADYYQYEIEI